jgi:hypothetical protein
MSQLGDKGIPKHREGVTWQRDPCMQIVETMKNNILELAWSIFILESGVIADADARYQGLNEKNKGWSFIFS